MGDAKAGSRITVELAKYLIVYYPRGRSGPGTSGEQAAVFHEPAHGQEASLAACSGYGTCSAPPGHGTGPCGLASTFFAILDQGIFLPVSSRNGAPLRLTQEEKSERSRSAILEAALKLFSKQGYRGTSIREIAEEAGVSTGNVYHHFPDKDALFNTLLAQYWAAIDSPDLPFNKALMDGAFPDDLEALARAAEETIRKHRAYVALIYVDVVEFEGTHIHNYYTEMSGRFLAFLNKRYPGDALKDKLKPGIQPNTAIMMASRLFLQYFAQEIVFGIPRQYGMDSETAIHEVSEIIRYGMLRTTETQA